jgi:dTDP-4-amino-4,6-dideoxygalactose transaminase
MIHNPPDFINRALGFDADGTANPWYYEMHKLGYNYRASAIHCALGLSQLAKLERFAARRAELVARYDERLAPLAPVVRPLGRRDDCRPAWHLYVIRVDFAMLGMSRAAMMRAMADKGIGTQVHYLPLHLQPYYSELYGTRAMPGAEKLYGEILSIPLFPAMSDADVDVVVDSIAAIVREKSRRRCS